MHTARKNHARDGACLHARLYSAFHACTARVGVTHAGPRLPHWQQITKNNSRSVGTRESCSSRASQHGQGRGSGAPMMQACGAFGMEAFLHLVLLRRSLRPEQRAIWITPRKILCEVSHTPTEKSCRRFSKPDSTSCAPCSRMQGDASRIRLYPTVGNRLFWGNPSAQWKGRLR
jgi:hypothetical protein